MEETPKDPKVKRPSPQVEEWREERKLLEALLIECGHMRQMMEKDLLEAQLRQAEKAKPPAPPPVDWMVLTQELIRAASEIIRTAIKESETSAAERRAQAAASPQQPGGNVQVTVNVR